MHQNPKLRLLALVNMFSAALLMISFSAQATDQGARFVHISTVSNTIGTTTKIQHPLTDNDVNAIVHVTQTWSPFADSEVHNDESIAVVYNSAPSPGRWGILNETSTVDLPNGAGFNVWIPPSDGLSFVHEASAGNIGGHTTLIDNVLTNSNAGALLMVTQNWNPGGGLGTHNDHVISVNYDLFNHKWSIINQDLAAMPEGASFNVTVLTNSQGNFTHSADAGNNSFDTTEIDNPLTNGKPNAIVMVTQNWSGGVFNDHPVGVYYNGSNWIIFDEDSALMPVGASFNVSVLPELEGVTVHTTTADNSVGNYTWFDHTLSDANRNALVQVTQNFNPGSVYNPHEFGVWYTGSQWSVFNQDQVEMPVNASFNIVIPPADSMSFLHTADSGNISPGSTAIDFRPLNGNPSAIFQVTQNWNPSEMGGTYNDHAIGVSYIGWADRWHIAHQDFAAMTDGASFSIWVPPTGSSTFIHSATAGNIVASWTTIDNSQTNDNPEAVLIVTQNISPGGINNNHPIGVWYSYVTQKWAVFNEDGAAMPEGAAFNVTVRAQASIFTDGFETGDTSLWSSVVP